MITTDSPASPVSVPRTTKQRILIVDDNRDAAKTMSMLLNLLGYETVTAFDGLIAIEAARDFRPEIILMDLGLPKLSGHDACRKIREELWGSEIVMIALTGLGQDQDRRASETAGFDRHLVKPVAIETLKSVFAEFPVQLV